tara:strand:+ start:394 stop:900 length:507 start_codon:yes stop_codon:yes gene_type:complete
MKKNLFANLKEIKNYFLKKENIYYFFLIITIFFLDRYTKFQIINNFNENIYFVNNFINIDLIWNTGISFGLLSSDSSLIYNSISSIIGLVIIFLVYFIIISSRTDKVIFSIIVGGAVGNFYDRLIYRAVPDFIDLHYQNFHWFTFNLADIFITIGIVAYIFKDLIMRQ